MTDKDYYKTIAVPTYRQKFLDRPVGTGGGMSISFLGKDAKITSGEFQNNDLQLGGRTFKDRYQFQSKDVFMVPTQGGMQQDELSNQAKGRTGWNPVEAPGIVEANLLFYDPSSDELVFRTTQNSDTPYMKSNITFTIPRKNVPDAEKLPIMQDGKKKTLKEILKQEDIPQTKALPLPNSFWSKPVTPYIPKSK